jgi:hypothetical protein
MKVTKEDRATLKELIEILYTGRKTDLKTDWNHYKKEGLSPTRFYFDLLAASMHSWDSAYFFTQYKDKHLETATRSIVTKLLAGM